MRMIIRGLFAALALSTFACSAQDSAAPQFKEGGEYRRVREVEKPADPKRIEVAEFFWYGCPHCYAFDPTVQEWKKSKPADVDFVQVPNSLGRPEGQLHAKAFYAAEALNVFDRMHPALFAAIHQERLALNTEAQIAQVFNRTTGILPEVFAGTFNGFMVDSRARLADQRAKSMGIASVPTVVVGGKYYTNATLAGGGFPQMIKVINFLVDKVRKERSGK